MIIIRGTVIHRLNKQRMRFIRLRIPFKMEASNVKKRRTTLFCGHCKKVVSRATFYRHKAQFYNDFNQTWYVSVPQIESSSSIGVTPCK